jgi:uncharacterized protein YvpB
MRSKKTSKLAWLVVPALVLVGWLVYQAPPVHQRLSWRIDLAQTYLRGVIHPAGPVPTPVAQITATPASTPTPMVTPTATPLPSPTPIPTSVSLAAPAYVLQGPNNCGPASLAMYLEYYGWNGTQEDIAQVVKPLDADRNVNPDELAYYVKNYAGWLNAEFRVGGDTDLLKRLLAAGFPVIIEETFRFDKPFWPNDDLWAAHYLLLTGYDDTTRTFTGQDSFHGANQKVPYATLDEGWKIFNRVYLMVYLPNEEKTLKTILGANWDVNANRQHALEVAQTEAAQNPQDAFAWFNIGSNQVFFENYLEAVGAFDKARTIGLPQRMLRYQFSPFFAYFHAGRMEDLMTLVNYALQRTPNSEEALVWKGWALYRQGDTPGAVESFHKALEANPNSQDAQYALNYVGG